MKHILKSTLVCVLALAPRWLPAQGLEVTVQLGASLPSENAETGLSPSISARGIKTFNLSKLRFGFGLTASHDFNYIRKDKPQADGSTGNGLSQSVYSTAKPPTTDVDVDVEQNNDQNVTITYPQAQQMIPPRTLRDLAPNSIFSLLPTASLGYQIGDFLPYLVAGAGLSRVSRQDGLSNWGNGYFVGAGVNCELGNDWFAGVEVDHSSIDTEVATYRNDKYFAQFGKRF